MVCIGLYLLLDTTLTNEQKSVKRPKPLFSGIIHKPEELSVANETMKQKFNDMNEDSSPVCSAPATSPEIDIQMGHVYDTIPFDNIDGGVWKQGWNVVYKDSQWNAQRKLQIFVVPHSHNDPGWKRTFEDYYTSQTRAILNNMVVKLLEDERRKFIWAEISYFSLWWSEIPQSTKESVKLLLSRGQLEIVTGGWVMADEANSHYYSVIQQLIHGHQWLLNNLGYKPRYSWSIDPFGLSPTFPFLLKEAGFKGLAVQRSHYSVKKYLALNKQLEFRWRQLWDNDGWTELLTHMMPFYSYDVPHTCGPDPKICCQFDFKRLPGYGVTCPWRVPPQAITQHNLAHRSELLLDQYKKKAQLYSTNVLLVPLGDDFRYDHSTEWDAQYINYQKIFDYINNNPQLHAHAQFGTLSDYFNALEKEKELNEFPTLSGDFFTYADREDHYWSGYYTSRPFYKRMDRVLLSYLRSAEILLTLTERLNSRLEILSKLNGNLSESRSSLSLFQHHDGITGTAKDHVVQDYASKMLNAINRAQHVIQQCSYYLLKNGMVNPNGNETYFVVDEHQKVPYNLAEGVVLTFPSGVLSRKIVLFNPLSYLRFEVISLRVENRFVQVRDSKGHVVKYQIGPTCSFGSSYQQCYLLSFAVELPPLSLTTYSIEPANEDSEMHALLKQFDPQASDLYDDWKNKEAESPKEFSLQNNNISVAFNKNGLLKAIIIKKPDNIVTIPIHLSFVRYSTKQGRDKSGAYLFLPDGEAQEIKITNTKVTIVEGKIMSQVIIKFPNVEHSVTIYNSDLDGFGVEIRNLINIASIKNNYEIAMRFSSNIKNGNIFYTDLNGFQIIKRKTLNKLPLQGNFYPMPSAVYIEDKNARLTVLSGQPLGVASLNEGQIEIMQDRRLLQDDNRGLDQPVMDNRPTLSVFRLIVETKTSNCEIPESVWGKLSGNAQIGLQKLLYPVQKLISAKEHVSLKDYISPVTSLPPNIHLISSLVLPGGIGVLLQSNVIERCYSSVHDFSGFNKVNLSHVIPIKPTDRIYKSTLTFNDMLKEIPALDLSICENDIDAYFIRDVL